MVTKMMNFCLKSFSSNSDHIQYAPGEICEDIIEKERKWNQALFICFGFPFHSVAEWLWSGERC